MKRISSRELDLLVERVVEQLKLDPSLVSTVKRIIDFESPKTIIDGEKFIEIEMAYPYRGLGQFSDTTWDSLVKLYPDILPWGHQMIGVPEADIRAILASILDSKKYHKRKFGVDLTDDVTIYLYHNQGANGAKHYLLTGSLLWPDQSKAAVSAFKEIDRGQYA